MQIETESHDLRRLRNRPLKQIVSSYSFASLGWHLTQALPLIVWPQAINGLLTIDSSAAMHPANAVENYFARSLGFALLALGACTVVLTGALPMTSLADGNAPPPSFPAFSMGPWTFGCPPQLHASSLTTAHLNAGDRHVDRPK